MPFTFLTSLATSALGGSGGTTSPLDTTGADLIIFAVAQRGTNVPTDSEGNTWIELHVETITESLLWYYAINPTTSATHTFTASGASSFPSIHVIAYDTGAGTALFDQKIVNNPGGSSTTIQPGPLTPNSVDALVVSTQIHQKLDAQAVTEGMVIREDNNSSFQKGIATADSIQDDTEINPSWSGGGSTERIAAMAVFIIPFRADERKPLVIDAGIVQQLQTPDVLEDVVYKNADLTPDNALIRADVGAIFDVQTSTASLADTGAMTLVQDSALETSGVHGAGFTIKDSTGAICFEISAQTQASTNLGIGWESLTAITTGIENVCVGTDTGKSISTATNNVLIGSNCGEDITIGGSNVGVGRRCLFKCVDGIGNMAIGTSALNLNVSGNYNVAVGLFSQLATTGDANLTFGLNAGRTLTVASNNIFFGSNAGFHASQLATVQNSIAFGEDTYTTASDQVILGNASITETVLRGNVFTGDGAYETLKTVSKTANYTIVDETFLKGDATSASITLTLPAAADLGDTPIHIKKIDSTANTVTIDANGTETIDGDLTVVITDQYTTITVVSDGTDWWIL